MSLIPPPQFGRDVKVKLVKKGFMDADFNVRDENTPDEDGKPSLWMLVDAVGGVWDSYFDYYLKYRTEGMEKSMILGCANIKKEFDYMWFHVTNSHQSGGFKPNYGNRRNIRWEQKSISGKWIIARRGRLFGPPPQEAAEADNKDPEALQCNLVGRLQISGTGTYWRNWYHETWEEEEHHTDDEGNRHTTWEHRSSGYDHSDCHMHDFHCAPPSPAMRVPSSRARHPLTPHARALPPVGSRRQDERVRDRLRHPVRQGGLRLLLQQRQAHVQGHEHVGHAAV